MNRPTTLDIETLELLEALLQDYSGTVFLVSHDRAFLDNVVTEVIAFEGNGVLREHVGGYTEWAEVPGAHRARAEGGRGVDRSRTTKRDARRRVDSRRAEDAPKQRPARGTDARSRRGRLNFKEERELSLLPARIETLETRIDAIRHRLADPALYRDAV